MSDCREGLALKAPQSLFLLFTDIRASAPVLLFIHSLTVSASEQVNVVCTVRNTWVVKSMSGVGFFSSCAGWCGVSGSKSPQRTIYFVFGHIWKTVVVSFLCLNPLTICSIVETRKETVDWFIGSLRLWRLSGSYINSNTGSDYDSITDGVRQYNKVLHIRFNYVKKKSAFEHQFCVIQAETPCLNSLGEKGDYEVNRDWRP